jgi:fibronectin type 3 domain-containing protein
MPRIPAVLIRSLLVIAALASSLVIANVQAASFPPGFSEVNIPRPDGAATWNEAVGMQFQANGRLWVWERGGRLWIVDDANPVTSAVLDISPEVGAWTDHGMLGFTLHPDFEATGYIYLSYVVDRHHLMNCDSPAIGTPVCSAAYNPATNEYNSATIGRIVRYRMQLPPGESDYRNARTVDLSSRRTLLGETFRGQPKSTGCPIQYSSHGVGTLQFGMDGTLLASCGDGASFNSVDAGNAPESYFQAGLADGIIRPQENVGAFRSQMVNSLAGKILRLDPDTGNGIPSNPFYDATAPRAAKSRVWALGIRNGFRFTVRPASGSHNPADANPGVIYLGDVGWNTYEDMDVVRTGGLNLGWPLFEGMTAHAGYTATNAQNLDAPNPLFGVNGCSIQYFRFSDLLKQDTLNTPSWPNPCNASQQITTAPKWLHTRPVLDWLHSSDSARWAAFDLAGNAIAPNLGTAAPDGSVVTGQNFSGSTSQGGVWYTGTDFPVDYKNTYFHGDYTGQWIRNFVFDSNNVLKEVRNFMTGAGGVVDMATNPVTGGFYYNSWTAFVRKVTYSPTGNVPPIAKATVTANFGTAPLTVTFDGTGSTDANNTPLTYLWDFGDGSPSSSSPTPTHTFNAPAGVVTNFDVTLTVRDPGNLTSQVTLLISVNNTPPNVTITSPVDNSTYVPGPTNINVPLSATFSDAQSPANLLSCQWATVLHHNTHQHEEPVVNSCSTTYSLNRIGCDGETYYYTFALTVTDPQGLQTVRQVRMNPQCTGGGGDTQAPTVPQNLTAQAINAGQINLSWSPSTDNGGGTVVGYRIYRGGAVVATTTGASYQDTTVAPSTTYAYRVTAFDDASPANESAQSNQASATTPAAPATVIRVNAGGPQYTDSLGQVWAADFGYNTGYITTVTAPINGTVDDALYQSDRWDSGGAPELAYAFPVPNGNYTVKLHFVEHWSGGQAVGKRVFDVFLENQLVLDNLDIFSQVGGYTLLVKTLQTTVSDGVLNINFAHGPADDPIIGAIEIISGGGGPPPPTDTQPPTVPQNLAGQANSATQIGLSWSASTDNGGGTVAGYRIYRNGTLLTTATGTTYTDNSVAASTTYTYRVSAFDNASPANESAQSNQVSVTTPAQQGGGTVIRVNAGGPAYTDSLGQAWQADTGYNTGYITTVTAPINGTVDDPLYQSDRWDVSAAPELAYAFPVPSGNYTVKLHFVEHWSGGQAVGKRVFDVFLENQLVLDNLDIFAEAGGYTLLVKTLQTTVSDGVLNINFAHGPADDPIIGAIEIISGGGAPPPTDTQPPTVPQNLTGQAVSASQVTLNWSASTDNGGGTVAGYRIYRNGTALTTVVGTSYADNTVTPSTAYTYSVTAYDNASPANESAQSAQVPVTTPAQAGTVIRVNTGGPQYTDSAGHVWAADFGYNTGNITTVTAAIAGTSDPQLYRSDRWDSGTAPEMAYTFNVPNGSYTVKLHFVEHWSGGQAVGRRVFDVAIENQLVLDNLDIFSEVGGYTLLVKTFQVTVADGQLNINFAHGSADDPIIGAIEILSN